MANSGEFRACQVGGNHWQEEGDGYAPDGDQGPLEVQLPVPYQEERSMNLG